MGPQILLVEGRTAKEPSCGSLLDKKGLPFAPVHSRRSALSWLESASADLIVVDARALRFDPFRFCDTLRSNGCHTPILLLLSEGTPFRDCGATIILQGPITPRKFVIRLKRLLEKSQGETLRAGDIVLNVKERFVLCGGQRHRLTPKQARLLEVLMRNRGRVLSRALLMREVWETDFLDDTRTLEVHIHWLRKAIESDPSRPVYLTTVRRLGYRFDVPAAEPPRPPAG